MNKRTATDYIIGAFLILLGIIIAYPFYNSILVSIVPQHVYSKTPFMLIPREITFGAYKHVLKNGALLGGLKITSIILILGVIYNMVLTTMTAYALSKPLPGRKIIMSLIIFTMYFSGGLIPFYLLIKQLDLMNKIASMILPTGFTVLYMIIVRDTFKSIPAELEESARIDGAGTFLIFYRIILPLALPILATFALYYSVERWNEWWHGMLFITSTHKRPLQLVLRTIVQEVTNLLSESTAKAVEGELQVFDRAIKMASVIVTMLPVMIMYPFLQKYFVKGLTVGAVKG